MSMGGFLLVWLIFMLIYALQHRLFGEGACSSSTRTPGAWLRSRSCARCRRSSGTASGEDGFDVMHWTMEGSGNVPRCS